MNILLSINVKRLLIGLISDTVFYFRAKHHDGAVHEVVHLILECHFVSDHIDLVEQDFLVGNNLDSLVAFDVEYISSFVDGVIVDPFSLIGELIHHLPEE